MSTWKDIPGYEGLYQASSDGKIRSLPREVYGGRGGVRTSPGKVLKQTKAASGYLLVGLSKLGKATLFEVHHLILMTYHGLASNDSLECRHKDGVKSNNKKGNLAWGTRKENIEDNRRLGTMCRLGKKPKLKASDVSEIRKSSLPRWKLAEIYRVEPLNIWRVRNRITWKNVA